MDQQQFIEFTYAQLAIAYDSLGKALKHSRFLYAQGNFDAAIYLLQIYCRPMLSQINQCTQELVVQTATRTTDKALRGTLNLTAPVENMKK